MLATAEIRLTIRLSATGNSRKILRAERVFGEHGGDDAFQE